MKKINNAEFELMKDEYEIIRVKEETKKCIDRLVCIDEVNKVKSFVNKIYNDDMEKHWGFLFGMRDNIHDMADKLADMQDWNRLQYFNLLMYGVLLEEVPSAVDGLHTMSKPMKELLLEKLMKVGDV